MAVEVSSLSNGLRVVCDPMPGLESLALGVWVGAGARHEARGEHGLAHFLEHMAFKGTQSRSALEIAETIEAVGGYINAYTSRGQTAYYIRLLKDDLTLGVDLLADILRRPTFAPDEFDRERGVILQEIARANDTPEDMVYDLLQEASYPDQVFGRAILGTVDSVGGASTEDLRAYRARYYHPSEMILSAAGGVEPQTLLRLAEAAFGDMPANPAPAEPEPARFIGGERRETGTAEQAHITLAFEGASIHDEAYYTAWAYGDILGGGMSSRLFQDIRERQGLAYAVHAGSRSYVDTGSVSIYAGTGPETVAPVIDAVARTMRAMAQDGVRDEELDRVKAQMRAGILMALESPASRAEWACSDLINEGRLVPIAEIRERIDAVEPGAIRDYAARVLQGPPLAFAAVGDAAGAGSYDAMVASFAGR